MNDKKCSVSLTTVKEDLQYHELLVFIFYTETRFTATKIMQGHINNPYYGTVQYVKALFIPISSHLVMGRHTV